MKVEICEVPARRVAYLRALGRYPQTFPILWPQFYKIAGPQGLFAKGARLSIMHDPLSKQGGEPVGDAAVEVAADWEPEGGLSVQTLPSGLYAIAEHRGPYGGLHVSWSELWKSWLPDSGYRVRDAVSFEIYVSDPSKTPAEDLSTLLHLPVERV